MKKTILFITPHLSTGGLPQYLYKQIETLHNDFDIYCIEWDNVTGGVLVVQRNRIHNILADRLISLGQDKHEIFNIIAEIQPDIIHLQEIPELFMQRDVADKLYDTNRSYYLVETSHDSAYNVEHKTYLPDKFLMVSQYQANTYKQLNIPCDVVEYPIEYKSRTKTRDEALRELGLDPALKHVINVGLFTPRKNQAEIIEYARILENYPIQFHFIGNQADNFKSYWEPLMQNFPSNCKWWNERDDVDTFYQAADLFLFTSQGNQSDHETMPLVIREALGWKIPSLIYNLPVYMNYFDTYDTIEYLTKNMLDNANIIHRKLFESFEPPQHNDKSLVFITAYAPTEDKRQLLRECIQSCKLLNMDVLVSSHTPLPEDIINMVEYYVYDADNRFNIAPQSTVWKSKDNVTVFETVQYAHEFPILKLIRNALYMAKANQYEFVLGVDFDNIFSPQDIQKILALKNTMALENKELIFFHPENASYNINGNNVYGIFYDMYIYGGKLNTLFDTFDAYFPKTIEEYNKNMAYVEPNKPQSFEYYFYDAYKSKKRNTVLVNAYVKEYFPTSKINQSTLKSHKSVAKILASDTGQHYLYIVNENLHEYTFRVSMQNKPTTDYKLRGRSVADSFAVIELSEACDIHVDIIHDSRSIDAHYLQYNPEHHNIYAAAGSVQFAI